jgi:hypothetical protein
MTGSPRRPTFSQAGDNTSSPHSAALHWQACAYCGLLAHFPLLTGSTPAFAAARPDFPLPVVIARTAVRAQLIFTAAQPRAPPAFS